MMAGKAFRIGHLGDINAPMVLGCLAGVEAAMSCRHPLSDAVGSTRVRALCWPRGSAS
jgi:aspartate aminotransferase-like enzyme